MHPVEELPVARLARVFLPGAVRPMASVAGTVHAPKPVHRWVWPVVFALLALYAGMALTASMGKGVSFDEGEELAVGYNGWLYHDFRMEGANGDLVKRWATLPFLFSHPSLPVTNRADWVKGDHPGTDSSNWAQVEPYALGYQFFFQNGNQPGMLLLQGRVMIVLLGIATGLLVFYCSREIFGSIGGLVSLGLFVFSPHMLAFGGIVSTEMSVFLTLLGATWSIWRLLHRVTWGRLFASLGFVALLFLAKATALVIFPIAAVLVAVKIFSPGRWSGGWAGRG